MNGNSGTLAGQETNGSHLLLLLCKGREAIPTGSNGVLKAPGERHVNYVNAGNLRAA